MLNVLWGIGGMIAMLALAVAISTDRRAINLRTVGSALALQLVFAFLVLYVPWGRTGLNALTNGVQAVIDSSKQGIAFLFGSAVPPDGEGYVFAFQVLPVIIFFASLTAVLYYWGILQKVVGWMGTALHYLLGTGRAESVSAATNVFLGQTESPLVVKPFVPFISRSGLFAIMVGGLATVAGSVLVGYALLGADLDQLIAAAFMAAPGALLMAKIVVPETQKVDTDGIPVAVAELSTRNKAAAMALASRLDREEGGVVTAEEPDTEVAEPTRSEAELEEDLAPMTEVEEEGHANVVDAAAAGAADGLKLAANIGAMLLAFISLIALVNLILGAVAGWFGVDGLTFEKILGWLFAPIMFVIGVPWDEAVAAGSFVGQKTIVNEFVAFTNFGPVADTFSTKTRAIITFALTGFANVGSLAILIGGLGGIAPNRRHEIARLGMRCVAAATLANLMSAAIAGMLIG